MYIQPYDTAPFEFYYATLNDVSVVFLATKACQMPPSGFMHTPLSAPCV